MEQNRIFIDIYGLGDELTPDVAEKDVTVARVYDTKEAIPDSMKVDAGRQNSFKALVYIHRYDRDTMARLRTGYVYKQQELYRTRIEACENRAASATTQSEKTRTKKLLKKLQAQFDEIHAYEEKIHHYADLRQPIDLDDGVKHNYTLFADILAKIK